MAVRKALTPLRFGVVGPGRVGSSLALWLRRSGGELTAWCGQRRGESRRGFPRSLERSLAAFREEPLDLALICVPEPRLAEVARELRSARSRVALHVSGASSCEALAPLRGSGAAVGSLHPLWPFTTVERRPPAGLVFGVDGDPGALRLARRLARVWGSTAVVIPESDRLLYHLAASLAAGGVATVASTAAALTRRIGLPAPLGEGFRALAVGAIAGLRAPGLDAGFTGPVARGEAALVAEQWKLLGARAPEFLPLVRLLAQTMLDRLAETGDAAPPTRALRALANPPGKRSVGRRTDQPASRKTTRRPPFS
jgi:predicted short-subunit dehydrogenase-like oxidoreductase (DUF2520 family)